MLDLRRRHLKSCPHRSITYTRCKCPIWAFGTRLGKRVRVSLDTKNWEEAQRKLRELDPDEMPVTMTVGEAGDRLLADCEARLRRESVGKYKLLVKEMKAFFGPAAIQGVTVDDVARYRESWKLAPVTARKKIERLRTFFRFCMERGWTKKNPAASLKPPKAEFEPTLPFSDSEMEKIMWAVDLYPEKYPMAGKYYAKKLKALVLLLRHSGLRIGDAVCLKQEAVKDGNLFLYTHKTKTPVWIPLPQAVLQALGEIVGGEYFFWSGNGTRKSAVGDWQRTLKKAFQLAGIKGHAHRFRDTFATSLLVKGVSLENVSILLGHESIKTTQKHYAPLVKSRQENLEMEVKKAWG